MSELDLSIIIVNWNSKDYLRKCLETVFSETNDIEFEVIVIDGGSFDGCSEMLSEHYPQVRFIQSERNVGFGQANNLGTRLAKGEVLLFLNPDTEVREHAIDRLYDQLSKLERPGAVGCRLLNSDGSVQTSCVQPFPTILNQMLDAEVLHRLFRNSNLSGAGNLLSEGSEPGEVEVVSGACLMIDKNLFEKVGGFSPEYFMYGEDLDLCFKARQAGFLNYHVRDAVIVHHGGGSTNRSVSNFSNVMMRESVYRLLRKTRGPTYGNCYRAALAGSALLRMALLGILFPAWSVQGKKERWNGAIRKWFGILRWGLGFEGWLYKYNQIERVPVGRDGGEDSSCAGSAEN